MGEARLKKSATAKFIAQFPQCAMCGGQRLSTTREHMPPKALFDNSHRPDKLVIPACHDCNNGTSKADLTASMVSRWNYHSPEQERQDHSRLVNQVRIQAPELIKEWTSLNHLDRSKAIDHLRFYGVAVPDDAGVAAIGKQTIRQLNIRPQGNPLLVFRALQKAGSKCRVRICSLAVERRFCEARNSNHLLRIVSRLRHADSRKVECGRNLRISLRGK